MGFRSRVGAALVSRSNPPLQVLKGLEAHLLEPATQNPQLILGSTTPKSQKRLFPKSLVWRVKSGCTWNMSALTVYVKSEDVDVGIFDVWRVFDVLQRTIDYWT